MTSSEKAKDVIKALNKLAKILGRDVNELRIIYAFERVIARIQAVPILNKNISYKGGFVLLKICDTDRYTKDLDVTVSDLDQESILSNFKKSLELDLDDGVWFGELEKEELPNAIRITFPFQIGTPDKAELSKLSRLNVDIEILSGQLGLVSIKQLSSILSVSQDSSDIYWRVLYKEYILAEKLEIFVSRGSDNSRGKDLYDINFLVDQLDKPDVLTIAIEHVFGARNAERPNSFYSFAKKIDTTTLSLSWKRLATKNKVASFYDFWKTFLDKLKKVDQILTESCD